jgi:hypothetical protein
VTRVLDAARTPLTAIATVDRVLGAHAPAVGPDLPGYRNHVYRVANLAVCLHDGAATDPSVLERIAVAAVHHDLGIWTRGTFDYLQPSIDLATAYLESEGRPEWIDEVATMIAEHHRLTPYRGSAGALVETFRRADWIDVTFGVRTFGLPRRFVRALQARWPNAGFHARLVALTAARLRSHPLSPLPMLKI